MNNNYYNGGSTYATNTAATVEAVSLWKPFPTSAEFAAQKQNRREVRASSAILQFLRGVFASCKVGNN